MCVTDVLEVEVLFGDFETNDHRIIIRNTVAILVRQLEFMKRCIEDVEFSDTFVSIVRQFTDDWRMQTQFARTDADLWRCRTIREYTREDNMDPSLRLWLAQGIGFAATKINVTSHGSADYAAFELQTDMQEGDKTYHFQVYKDVLLVLFDALINKAAADPRLDAEKSNLEWAWSHQNSAMRRASVVRDEPSKSSIEAVAFRWDSGEDCQTFYAIDSSDSAPQELRHVANDKATDVRAPTVFADGDGGLLNLPDVRIGDVDETMIVDGIGTPTNVVSKPTASEVTIDIEHVGLDSDTPRLEPTAGELDTHCAEGDDDGEEAIANAAIETTTIDDASLDEVVATPSREE
eukprot:gene29544-36803_t